MGGAALYYALTALHARPIVGWALKRTLASLGSVVSTASRALPLLLVFIAFLFINAEAWQMTSNLDFGTLWLTAVLLLGLGAVFLLVRLPEEVDQADDAVDDAFLLRACRGTPLEQVGREMVDDPGADPAAHAEIAGFARWNLDRRAARHPGRAGRGARHRRLRLPAGLRLPHRQRGRPACLDGDGSPPPTCRA